jgi:hypothetical protein
MHTRMLGLGQPGANRRTAMAGGIVRDQVQVSFGIGSVKGVQQLQIK